MTEEPFVDADANEETEVEPTTTTQRTTTQPTTVKPAKTKPAATKPQVTKPPTTKAPVTKPPTTKHPVTKPPTTNAPAANVVIIPLKYVVKQVETTERFYDAENGGYRNRIYVTFDRTGYSATTGDLLNEARQTATNTGLKWM